MRTSHADVLPTSKPMRVLPLDVTKPGSIAAILQASGPIVYTASRTAIDGSTASLAHEIEIFNVRSLTPERKVAASANMLRALADT